MIAIEAEQLDLRMCGQQWRWANDNRAAIDKHWQRLRAANPKSWNGFVLMATEVSANGGAFRANFIKTDFASFIAWRDWDWPDKSVFNLFGSALVMASDGALIYGVMAGRTLNAGLCYPPGGSLDMGDVGSDGRVNVLGSIARELTEETGLVASQARTGELLYVVDEQRISIAQTLCFDETGEALAAKCRSHIAAQIDSELDKVMVLRKACDLKRPAPGYAAMLADYILD